MPVSQNIGMTQDDSFRCSFGTGSEQDNRRGIGIIVIAVAIMPMLGIGGMQLYRAETPGPIKDSKLTPRITETAKALWYIYLSLTIACALAFPRAEVLA